MIKAIIIEDEFGARESLKTILKEYITDVIVIAEAVDIPSGIKVLNDFEPDIVFMDIQLRDGESFRILDEFDSANFQVIFITAYSDYLQKAFDYFSFQYLTKPIDIEKLEKTIAKFRQRKKIDFSIDKLKIFEKLLETKPEILTIPHAEGIRVLSIPDIVRLEADGSYTTFHLVSGENFISTKGIGYYEKALKQHNFYRTHKSHLVNVSMIADVSFREGILLKNNDNIPLAQRTKKDFLDFLAKQ